MSHFFRLVKKYELWFVIVAALVIMGIGAFVFSQAKNDQPISKAPKTTEQAAKQDSATSAPQVAGAQTSTPVAPSTSSSSSKKTTKQTTTTPAGTTTTPATTPTTQPQTQPTPPADPCAAMHADAPVTTSGYGFKGVLNITIPAGCTSNFLMIATVNGETVDWQPAFGGFQWANGDMGDKPNAPVFAILPFNPGPYAGKSLSYKIKVKAAAEPGIYEIGFFITQAGEVFTTRVTVPAN